MSQVKKRRQRMSKKKEKCYFYFASSHDFSYPLYVPLLFAKKKDHYIRRWEGSKWVEVERYAYHGEYVTCIIPAEPMTYDFVFGLLHSKKSDNIYGAINYMLQNYKERFLQDVGAGKYPDAAAEILWRAFRLEKKTYFSMR